MSCTNIPSQIPSWCRGHTLFTLSQSESPNSTQATTAYSQLLKLSIQPCGLLLGFWKQGASPTHLFITTVNNIQRRPCSDLAPHHCTPCIDQLITKNPQSPVGFIISLFESRGRADPTSNVGRDTF